MMRCLRAGLLGPLLLLLVVGGSLAAQAGGKNFGSVGLQVVPTVDGDLVVLRVVEATPAAAQGLRAGDLIVRVDEFVLKGSDFGKVIAEHLWGPVGSRVTLHFLRPGVSGPQSAVLTRIALDPALTVTPAAQGARDGARPEGSTQ